MKKNYIYRLLIVLAFLAGTLSCAKEETEPVVQDPVNTTPPVFNWKLNNSLSFSSDSTHCYPSFTTIYAFKNGNSNSLEITLLSLNQGNYVISSATGNQLKLYMGGTVVTATGGNVNISSDAGNKLSGTVSATFATGTYTLLTGEFTDIPKRN